MRQAVLMSLLVLIPALAIGAANQTVLAPDVSSRSANAFPGDGRSGPPGSLAGARFTIGKVDTVGGTTYDNQFNGPSWRLLVNAAGHGIYVVWMYSADTTIYFPGRNMRLNYYDRALHKWVYSDSTSFMSRGLNVFGRRAGFGGIDVDTSGTPFISCHATLGGATRPWVDKGVTGNYSDTTLTTCMWPPIAVGQTGAVHIFPITSSYGLTYCRIAPDSWPHWSAPMSGIVPTPGFPSQNIAASKVSNKVALVWEVKQSHKAYQMYSTDGGLTWDSTSELVPPAAYGVDTLTGFGTQSLFPFYDRHDRLHVVANLSPVVNDTALPVPSQIWHYCPDDTPQWSRIHCAGCNPANMKGVLDSNATYACRPSMGEDQAGGLYVAWEQFDSLNVDTTTSYLRADIFMAQDSGDNGASWQPSVRITGQGSWSCRFPSAIDYFDDDTFRVTYVIDQVAGLFTFTPSEGVVSRNPVVVQRFSVPVGIAEGSRPIVPSVEILAAPNPFGRATTINYQLGRAGSVTLTVHDVAGKAVRRLAGGPQPAGLHSVSWNGRDDRGRALPTGVYFCTLDIGTKRISRKVVMTE
ncbi:MAG TPA: FlgD immunoglobulin-like domain containing protein [bacterium]|nr:FlgD immunoglobulin-like domain containing protein [bacterium]